jgi:hypothetical protein
MIIGIANISKIIMPKKGNRVIQIQVNCPYCSKKHLHGVGTDINNISSYYGTKISHCIKDQKQYEIRL